jgi:hypothetical protein
LVGGALLIGVPLTILCDAIWVRLGLPESWVQHDSAGNRTETLWHDIICPLALVTGAGLGVLVAWLTGWWVPPA